MGFAQLKKKAHELFDQAAWITCITKDAEYDLALALMEELIEDYENNKPLIDILSISIARWEDDSKQFTVFNKEVSEMNQGIALLRVLMNQHDLGVADFPEIGSKSLVSKVINGHRNLTTDHISALSKRFGISPALFYPSDDERAH